MLLLLQANGISNMSGGNGRKAGLFSGLRFLLAGFEEDTEKQFVEQILETGGQVCKLYDSSCTHVVVVNLPMNDPICRAAKEDGKVLVTAFWITDCLDTEAVVEINNVMYRPLKDMDGIDGCKKLCICLTGYQGLARKNIMRMVDMMGARFSKPLIGSQVTDLICYKFEGEKFELAKKMGIRLVNHFWLEDSLNLWTLLPQSSYAQSGLEAEDLRANESVVEDSGEDEEVARQDSFTVKKSSCDKVAFSRHAQFLNESNWNLGVVDDLGNHSESHGTSKSCYSLSPPASLGETRDIGSAVNRITDGTDDIGRLEHMSIFSKPSAGGFPINLAAEATDHRNGTSLPNLVKDGSTHLYVEEGNESDNFSSYDEAKSVEKLLVSEPEDPIATTGPKMETMDFAKKHTTGQTDNVADYHKDFFGDVNVESSRSKRRRSSEFTGMVEEPPLENSCGEEEVKAIAYPFLEENVPCGSALNEQPIILSGSNVTQKIRASPAGPCLPDKDLSQEKKECAPKSSFSTETSAVEISSNETDYAMRDADCAQFHSAGNSGHVHQDGADVDVPFANQGVGKTIETMTVQERKTAPKTDFASIDASPVSLARIAQSYNLVWKEKNGQNMASAVQDEVNKIATENDQISRTAAVKKNATSRKKTEIRKISASEPSKIMCFAVGGTTDERTKLHSIIKFMGARICKSRYQWRDEATHVVLPGPLRRTEKFLAGSAAGRWILKPEYLEASRKAGKFLEEEAYEWYGEGTNEKGSVSLLAPRKWRMSVATSGVGAFDGLRVLFYGKCISPPLDTMKRAIKAGGGVVLATAPPFTRHLTDGVNFAIIGPGISREDPFVQEFLKHEVTCVVSEYLVNLVCNPVSSLEKYILYETEKASQQQHNDGIRRPVQHKTDAENDDTRCSVCDESTYETVMLLCGDGEGKGCNAGTHIFCCDPPLQSVPDEDWFCSRCK